jgi:hypothetical protein
VGEDRDFEARFWAYGTVAPSEVDFDQMCNSSSGFTVVTDSSDTDWGVVRGAGHGDISDTRPTKGLVTAATGGWFVFEAIYNELRALYSVEVVAPTVPTASFSASDCIISEGDSTCSVPVSWDSSDTDTPRSVRYNGAQFSTLESSTVNRTLNPGTHTFTFHHDGGTQLALQSVTARCASSTTWNGSSCASAAAPSVDLTVRDCSISADNNSCVTNVSWEFIDSDSPWSVRQDGASFASAETNISGVNRTLNRGTYSFTFHHDGGTQLARQSVTIGCDFGTTWDGSVCAAPVPNTPTASFNSSGCTISSGNNTCNANVRWQSSDTNNPRSIRQNGSEFSNVWMDTENVSFDYGLNTFTFYHDGGDLLATYNVVVRCGTGSAWNGSACEGSNTGLVMCPSSSRYNVNIGGTFTPTLRYFNNSVMTPSCSSYVPSAHYTNVRNNPGTSWFTADTAIASVNNTGTIRGQNLGTTNVTATYGGLVATKDVRVGNTPRLIVCPSLPTVAVGDTLQLESRYWNHRSYSPSCFSTGYTDVTNSVDFWRANTSGVSVNSVGLVTAVQTGNLEDIVTTRYNGLTNSTYITVIAAALSPSASISITPCAIQAGDSACANTVDWSSSNTIAPRALEHDGLVVSNAENGPLPAHPVRHGVNTFTFSHDGGNQLDNETVSISCAAGAAWNGSLCAGTPTANLNASDCTISIGNSSCTTNVSWSSSDTVSPLSISQNGTEFSTVANNAVGVARTLNRGTNTFTFEDNGTQLADETATASCAGGSAWSTITSQCVAIPAAPAVDAWWTVILGATTSVLPVGDPATVLVGQGLEINWDSVPTADQCQWREVGNSWSGFQGSLGSDVVDTTTLSGIHNFEVRCRQVVGGVAGSWGMAALDANVSGPQLSLDADESVIRNGTEGTVRWGIAGISGLGYTFSCDVVGGGINYTEGPITANDANNPLTTAVLQNKTTIGLICTEQGTGVEFRTSTQIEVTAVSQES